MAESGIATLGAMADANAAAPNTDNVATAAAPIHPQITPTAAAPTQPQITQPDMTLAFMSPVARGVKPTDIFLRQQIESKDDPNCITHTI